jgi:hypothetical protein
MQLPFDHSRRGRDRRIKRIGFGFRRFTYYRFQPEYDRAGIRSRITLLCGPRLPTSSPRSRVAANTRLLTRTSAGLPDQMWCFSSGDRL